MGNGEVGEGGRGEGEDGGRGRSTTKPVSSTEPISIKYNNQPMMVVTVSRDKRTWRVIEQQVREARQGGEDGGGGRSVTKPTTKEEEGATMTRQTTINKQCGPRFAPLGQISNNIPCLLIQCLKKRR